MTMLAGTTFLKYLRLYQCHVNTGGENEMEAITQPE